MATLDQDSTNALLTDLQQAATKEPPPPVPGGMAPTLAPISETIVEDPYKSSINTGTSDRKNLYQDEINKLNSKDLIIIKSNNTRNFETNKNKN